MPTYAFRCRACGHAFDELVQHFGDTAPCPKCGSAEVERTVSAPAAPTSPRLRGRARGSSGCGPAGFGFG